jgi:hypothetical protein
MMHVNCEFLLIWMLDLISVNLVISWLVPGCSPRWFPNPGWIQDAASKQAAVTVGVAYVSITGIN